jgi:hypothetical protein
LEANLAGFGDAIGHLEARFLVLGQKVGVTT